MIIKYILLILLAFLFPFYYACSTDIEFDQAIEESLALSLAQSEVEKETEDAILESILDLSLEEQVGEKKTYKKHEKERGEDFTILKARVKGDSKYLWDCSWEVLKNASFIYNTLKKLKFINKDISNIPYASWFPKSTQYNKLNITFDQMKKIISDNKLLDQKNYTSIEGNPKTLYSLDINTLKTVISFNINNIKDLKKSGTIFVFFVNPGAHWFTIVAYNKQGKIHYYIADDTPGKIEIYKDTIKLIKKLML